MHSEVKLTFSVSVTCHKKATGNQVLCKKNGLIRNSQTTAVLQRKDSAKIIITKYGSIILSK